MPEYLRCCEKNQIIFKFVLKRWFMEYSTRRKSREDFPEITEKYIDVRRIFSDKNPRLAKSLPGFIFRILELIIHQDEINDFMFRNKDSWGLDYTRAILHDFQVSTEVVNPPLLDPEGRYLVVSNHPLGGMDGIALLYETGKLKKEVLFPVNDLLLNLPNLYELFIPVNKHGSNAENIKLFNDTFASNALILYFPAGLVSRKQSGVIRDIEWKKTFLTKAKSSGRDIIPVYISGRNTNFFYNLASFRKKIGIKANIEMLFLPDQLYRYKNKVIRITYGKPIPITVFDKRNTDQQWALLLREHVYKLERNPDQEFNY
jgi:putative hemolysin